MDSPDEQVLKREGFDHTFVLKEDRNPDSPVATVIDDQSGRKLELYTTEPGLQFYTGNALDGTVVGKNGVNYGPHTGFCLEPGHFPNSPNEEKFPSTLLKPGEVFQSKIEYRFGTA